MSHEHCERGRGDGKEGKPGEHGLVRQSREESEGAPAYCQMSCTVLAFAAASKNDSLGLLECTKCIGVSIICNRSVTNTAQIMAPTWRDHLTTPVEMLPSQAGSPFVSNKPEKGVSVILLLLIWVGFMAPVFLERWWFLEHFLLVMENSTTLFLYTSGKS